MIVLGIGSNEVLDGAISIGTLYIFSQYIQQFFDPIQELAEQFSTLAVINSISRKDIYNSR